MEPIKAKILSGDTIILEEVDVWLNETQGPSFKSWDGHFDLEQIIPELKSPETRSIKFRLILADGRFGEFFVKKMVPGKGSEISVDFQGTGLLE